ncbi:FxSxx-COOH system tetratricopeptide repeat protein [Frankia sp. R43]|uniref:FxSxx-COOH system tetratricopeptide repeat protein n=1 Tax=Frankia sp. R43 TaxID=269536 RepID=UPI0006CA50BD|nr:FxSxx-COOH system tetratricopeptide repeat protein [Frankia sp. R43]
MVEGLSGEQVRALAEVFSDERSARSVLEQAGFAAGRFPWGAWNAVQFWWSVAGELKAGAVVGGTARLLTAVRELYPGNAVFAGGVGGRGPGGRLAWNVPGRPVRFVGRESLLERVHGALSGSARVALVALDGMGGVGKTSVALEYAHRYADGFEVVWWVPSERAELVGQHVAGLAGSLGLPVGSEPGTVWSALGQLGSWLVVFDNVDDDESVRAVAGFVPSAGGRVLVTSRHRAVRGLGVPVPVLDRAASVELITGRVPGVDTTAAGRLAELMGDLPLGVEAAAGFLDETDTPAGEYAALLAERPGSAVEDVWGRSVERLRVGMPAAVELLELCAWCDAEPIPLDLFTGHPDRLGGTLGGLARDRRGWAEVVGALVRFSLARRDGDRLIVHRLVGAAVRDAMSDTHAADTVALVAGLLVEELPGDVWGDPASWPRWEALLAHVLTVTDRGRHRSAAAFGDLCWLADRAATYLEGRGHLPTAVDLFERVLTDRLRVLGTDHPNTLASRSNLAGAYETAGRVGEAIDLYEQVLTGSLRILGADHPDTLASRLNLAYAYRAAGRAGEAIGLFKQVLSDSLRVLGTDHPNTLMSRHNLAYAYQMTGQAGKAIDLYEQVLIDRLRILGPDHTDTLTSWNNLAHAYQTTGQAGKAIDLFKQVLTDSLRALGTDHPNTLASRHDLARAYQATGRVNEAIDLYEQVLTDSLRILGTDHPNTLASRSNLAGAYETAGRVAEAVDLYEQVLTDSLRALGTDHPITRVISENLTAARTSDNPSPPPQR